MAKSVAELLSEREGTRLDFKQDLSSTKRVLETVCSFLNSAGGTLVVGVEDQTRAVLGLDQVEKQEEKLANAVASSIEPQPTIQLEIVTHDGRDLLLLRAAYAAGPSSSRTRAISMRSLERDLRHLREAGVVEFVGAPQIGFYRRK
jgi:predicted HTH transcriptional regulator